MLLRSAVSVLAVVVTVYSTSASASSPPVLRPNGESRLEELASRIPGFAGLYYARDGKLTVSMVGSAGAPAARAILGQDIRLERAEYQFHKLKLWRDRLMDAMAIPGVISLDLDEVRNRVVFGFAADGAAQDRDALLREIAARNVPYEAVVIEESDRIEFAAALTDDVRPQPGGVQVESGGQLCTLGFNVSFEAGEGFVTNSHCTSQFGAYDGLYVGWGMEERDLEFSTYGCPSGKRCRYSDSALIHYAFGVEQGDGATIARPATRNGACPSSIQIDSLSPRLNVKNTVSSPVAGQSIEKIGRSTGWTVGQVNETCLALNLDSSLGSNLMLLCQHKAAGLGAAPGDSGSPVFVWDGANGVTLHGLLWGRVGGISCGSSYFSDVGSILWELGPMTIGTCPTC
jgi:hypothetical protein